MIKNVEHSTGVTTLMCGYSFEDIAKGIDCVGYRQPLGVFACIAPCNFPAMVLWWFLPYALVTGNTHIVKHSEQVPMTQTKIFEIVDEVGFPEGVVNMMHGSKDVIDLVDTRGFANAACLYTESGAAVREFKYRVKPSMIGINIGIAAPMSFSKTAGFTGTRCAYTVVPRDCFAFDAKGGRHALNFLWNRRKRTKFNGVSYPVQKAAAAIYSEEGQSQVRELVDYYLRNAALVRKKLTRLGFECVGGDNSPYDSWGFFDLLLKKAGVVCTPGAGFGRCGQGYARISAFNSYENVQEAMERIARIF